MDARGLHKTLWRPLTLDQLTTLLECFERPWWIAGGWALDLYLKRQTRFHEDLDIAIRREDQVKLHQMLSSWDLQAVDPPGMLRPWDPGEILNPPIHNVWGRQERKGPWNLEILLCDFEQGDWVYRRNSQIRGPQESFGWRTEKGWPVLAPEIQLLYKSRNPRPKDVEDLRNTLPHLPISKKQWLEEAIIQDSGEDHPWLEIIY